MTPNYLYNQAKYTIVTETEFKQHLESFLLRPHLVILGAGATMATIPNGDKNGKKSCVMDNMIDILNLGDILKDVKLKTESKNIEDIYSELSDSDIYKEVRDNLELAIRKYFCSLELPDFPTIYDLLVLSLRDKDCIASFNWDDLLIQAYQRVSKITKKLPILLFLHGNISAGFCTKCNSMGSLNSQCPECGQPFEPSPLLFPVRKKDYSNFFFITQWQEFKDYVQYAGYITIFGYSAPKSDVEAIKIMQEAFSTESKLWHAIEVIDTGDESKITDNWSFFGEPTHWHFKVIKSLFNSILAEFPRRSLEGYYKRNYGAKGVWFGKSGVQLNPDCKNILELFTPLLENEKRNDFDVI